MKNTLKSKLIKTIIKTLKIPNEKKLLSINRKNFVNWDSLAHLQIIFLLEKNIKKKIPLNKLNKISNGKELLKIINANCR